MQNCIKNAIIYSCRSRSHAATEDAPWIIEVFIADHCAFVRLRLTEIYGNLYTRQTSNCRARKIWNRHYSIGQLFDIVTREVYITPA